MNRIYWIITSFFGLIIVFTLGYYATFQYSLGQQGNEQVKNQNMQTVSTEDSNNAVAADGKLQDRVQASTELIEEHYDVAEATYSDNKRTLPSEYIGCSKDEIIEKINAYMAALPKEEVEEGLISMKLVSFSEDTIRIRKVYDNKNNYEYFIAEKDGYLVVYENDKETVVEVTDISYDNLEDSEKEEINAGVYVGSDDELYGILESYSS